MANFERSFTDRFSPRTIPGSHGSGATSPDDLLPTGDDLATQFEAFFRDPWK